MRLVHLATYISAQTGSFVPFMLGVLVQARERGWEAEAVFPPQASERDWVDEFRRAGIPVEFAGGTRAELTAWVRGSVEDGGAPALLHSHFTTYDVPVALTARGRDDVAAYWHVHTVLSSGPRALVANAAKFGLLGRSVDRILTPSGDVAAALKRRLAPPSKVTVFPNAIDTGAYPQVSDLERRQARRDLGLPEGARVLLHFGRHWRLKDGEIFLDAVAELLRGGRPVVALVNQGGEEARRAAASRGLQAQVEDVGVLSDAGQLYSAADLLVASSRGETMPYTVVEALCSGIPVVASDLAGHRFVGDRLEACAIVERDASQYARAIGEFLDMDPARRQSICTEARAWVVENLDVGAAAARLIDDYERTMSSKQGRG